MGAGKNISHLGTTGRDPETQEQMLLFYGGPFSQWAGSTMMIDGVRYNGPEQYMMAQKARFFEDEAALALIMDSESPRRQKAIGRMVKNFDAARWAVVARDVVRTATLHKFARRMYRRDLLDTIGYTLVEASATDVVWGIGLAEDDYDALCRSKWRGTNWLGQCLMEVRSIME